MRCLEKKMVQLVNSSTSGKCGDNTEVDVVSQGNNVDVSVFLFGHEIYKQAVNTDGSSFIYFNLCGHNTRTTRSRLCALGVPVSNKGGVPYHNGEAIKSNGWIQVEHPSD